MTRRAFGATFAAVAMMVLPAAAWGAPIAVQQRSGTTEVVVKGGARTPFSVYRLEAPPRLVVRMSGMQVSPGVVDAYTQQVSQVRVLRKGRITEVVIGLTGRVTYEVKKRGSDLVVRISGEALGVKNEVARLRKEESELRRRLQAAQRRLQAIRTMTGNRRRQAKAEEQALAAKVQEYRSKMNELEQRRNALEASIQEYQKRLAQARKTERELRTRLASMETKLSALVKQSEAKERELARLRKETSSLSSRRDAVKREVDALSRRLASLRHRVQKGEKGAREQMEQTQARLRSRKARLAALERELSALSSRKARLSREIADQEKRLSSMSRQYEATRHSLENHIRSLKNETQRLKAQRDALRRELADLAAARKNLGAMRARAAATKKELASLEKRMRELRRKVAYLERREQEMTARYEKARMRLDRMNEKLENTRQTIESLTSKKQEISNKIKELQRRHTRLTAQEDARLKHASAQERKRILAERKRREQELRALARRRNVVERRLEQARRDVAWLQKKARRLQAKVAKVEARLDRVRAEVARYASARDSLSAEMKELRDRRASLASEIKERRRELDAIEHSIAVRNRRLSSLERVLAERKNALTRLAREEKRHAARVAQLSSKVEALRATMAQYRQEVRRLQNEKTRLASESARLRTERDRLARQVAKLKLTNSQLSTVRPQASGLVKGIDFVDSPWSNQVILTLDRAGADARIHRKGRFVEVEIPGVIVKPELKRRIITKGYRGPIVEFVTWDELRGTRPVTRVRVKLAGKRRYELRHRPGKLVILVAKNRREIARSKKLRPSPKVKVASYGAAAANVARQMTAAPRKRRSRKVRSRRRYTGRFVDLDFKDADIQNVIRLVAEVWGKNVVIPDDVKGTITIRLTNVRVDRAFDVILKSKGLAWKDEGGNIIRIITLQQLQQERQEKLNQMKAKVTLTPLQTRLIPVNYAEADKIAKIIDKNVKSSRGRVTVDKRTNIIIYVDVPAKIRLAQQLVRSLDLPTPQVQIEARIVEAESNFIREIGIQWGGSMFANAANGNPTGLIFPSNVGLAGGAMDQKTMTSGVPAAGAANPDFAVNLPANVGTGSGGALGISLGSLAGAVNVNLRLSAMEEIGQVRSIAAPKITTLDNVEAKITQGVEIPYPLSSAQGNTVIMKQAVLSLAVTPHVTNDGRVRLKIKVTKDEPDETHRGADGSLGISKKSAETELLVRSGDTVVIGGIYKRQSTLTYRKVPWFADIPIVGWFFKNQYKKDTRSEILIFITPRVLNRRPVTTGVAPGAGK